jgi:hypothetical protein
VRAHLAPEGGCDLNIGPWPIRPLLRERKRRGKGEREGFKTGPLVQISELAEFGPGRTGQ